MINIINNSLNIVILIFIIVIQKIMNNNNKINHLKQIHQIIYKIKEWEKHVNYIHKVIYINNNIGIYDVAIGLFN